MPCIAFIFFQPIVKFLNMNRLHTFRFELKLNSAQQCLCAQLAAFNILERGLRLLSCGDSTQLDRSMKQEPTETTFDALAA
jgi:hypothetical protein